MRWWDEKMRERNKVPNVYTWKRLNAYLEHLLLFGLEKRETWMRDGNEPEKESRCFSSFTFPSLFSYFLISCPPPSFALPFYFTVTEFIAWEQIKWIAVQSLRGTRWCLYIILQSTDGWCDDVWREGDDDVLSTDVLLPFIPLRFPSFPSSLVSSFWIFWTPSEPSLQQQ